MSWKVASIGQAAWPRMTIVRETLSSFLNENAIWHGFPSLVCSVSCIVVGKSNDYLSIGLTLTLSKSMTLIDVAFR